MEIFQQIFSLIFIGLCLISWLVFLSQIKSLIKWEKVKLIPFVFLWGGLIWGTLGVQASMFISEFFEKNFSLLFGINAGLFLLIIVLFLVNYYWKYSSERKIGF